MNNGFPSTMAGGAGSEAQGQRRGTQLVEARGARHVPAKLSHRLREFVSAGERLKLGGRDARRGALGDGRDERGGCRLFLEPDEVRELDAVAVSQGGHARDELPALRVLV